MAVQDTLVETRESRGARGNPIIPNHTHLHACIGNRTPVNGHGKRSPKIIMKLCAGHTKRIFLYHFTQGKCDKWKMINKKSEVRQKSSEINLGISPESTYNFFSQRHSAKVYFWFLELCPSVTADNTSIKNNLLERTEITSNASTISNRGSLQSNLQPLTVYHGYCITCEIGFVSTDKRNIKRGNFWKLTVLCRFKVVEAWEKVDHEYNEIN